MLWYGKKGIFTSAAMKDTNPWLVGQYCWNDWDMSLSRPSMYWKSKSGKRRSSTFCAEAPSPATNSDIDGMSSSIMTIVLPLMPLLQLLVVASTSCISTVDVDGYDVTSCMDCGPGDEFWLSDAVDTDGLTSLSPYLSTRITRLLSYRFLSRTIYNFVIHMVNCIKVNRNTPKLHRTIRYINNKRLNKQNWLNNVWTWFNANL